jgi:hypothetical protein
MLLAGICKTALHVCSRLEVDVNHSPVNHAGDWACYRNKSITAPLQSQRQSPWHACACGSLLSFCRPLRFERSSLRWLATCFSFGPWNETLRTKYPSVVTGSRTNPLRSNEVASNQSKSKAIMITPPCCCQSKRSLSEASDHSQLSRGLSWHKQPFV